MRGSEWTQEALDGIRTPPGWAPELEGGRPKDLLKVIPGPPMHWRSWTAVGFAFKRAGGKWSDFRGWWEPGYPKCRTWGAARWRQEQETFEKWRTDGPGLGYSFLVK